MKKICIVEPIGIPIEEIRSGLPGHDVVEFDSRGWSDSELIDAARGAEVLGVSYRRISADLINSLPDLKLIAVAFTGIDHVDLNTARQRDILVRNAAGYAETAVAELVIGFMISLARSIPQNNNAVRQGGLSTTGTEIKGKTLGIIGGGSIGGEIERLATALGMTALVFDLNSETTIETVFAKSDYVTIHVPLTEQTRSMVSARLLGVMKPTAFLINTARGPIVDADALHTALTNGTLAGAALDVFDVEPPIPIDNPLLHLNKVIATPHIGFNTAEALVTKGRIALKNIQDYVSQAGTKSSRS
jgi:phosphoglycerate dehydrogenase-like enzyme